MITTNKQEAEVLEIYETWLYSYLNGDVKTYDSYLADDYHFIGSTDNEDFLNRADTTKFFEATADQLAGKAEIRNNRRTIEKFDEIYFITDLFDAYFLNDKEWAFYGKFRFTSALKKNKEGWRFIYQHFSTPDSKAQEGETLGTQQIAEENLQLREAVQRRTTELEHKTRDLEVEAALEKVRSRSLAMQKSEELAEVATLMFQQMKQLGIETYSSGFNIWDEDHKTLVSWMSNPSALINPPFVMPINEYEQHGRFYKAWKNHVPFLEDDITGKRMAKHYQYLRSFPLMDAAFSKSEKAGIKTPERQVHNAVFFNYGYLLFITLEPRPQFQDIFKRFANVFEQTYTRFLDLKKAEAQAREAEIELALERVRARTMAMQHSNELSEASFLLDSQVRALGIKTRGCAFNIYGENESTEWFSSEMGTMPTYKTTKENVFLRYYEEGKKGNSMFIESFKGDGCAAHYDYLCTLPVMGEALKKMIESGGSFPTQQIDHVTYFKYGYLLFITLEPVPDAHDIFLRFAKVFEQTYTRFLDLQKVEAQAREAQIELALERVRARTMAMQRSEELQEAAVLLLQQVIALGVPVFGTGFNIWDDDRKEATAWMGGQDRMQPPFKTSSSEDIFLRIYQAAERGDSLFVEKQAGEALKTHYEYMNSIPVFIEIANKMAKAGQSFPTFQIMHCAYFSQGYLMFITFEPVPDSYDIFKRFAKVFEQTYTRFLDLQKAEEQAREAQIEAGLERARAQSMMMQHSKELNKTSQVFHEQLHLLGIESEYSYLWLPNEDNAEHLFWATWQEEQKGQSSYNNKQVIYPLDKTDPAIAACYIAWESENPVHVNPVQANGVEDYFNEWTELLEGVDKFKPENYQQGLYYVDAYMKYGCFGIMIRKQLSKDEQQILHRFSTEFERAYTRFLDLQKAEGQAREAQIEAALEKVRSRSLAMHSANELGEVVAVIVEKLKDLDVVLDANGVVLCTYFQDSKDVLHWIAAPDFSFAGSYLLPYFDHPIFNDAWESRESGVEYFSKAFSVEEKNSFFKYAFEHSDYRNFPDDFKDWVFQNDKHILSFAWQKNSAILIPSHTGVVPSANEVEILKRFARVFEQAYVRFLDLKKAEAQAREAQIEAALERVRSRSMAMNNSNELQEVISVVFVQMQSLGIKADASLINILIEDSKDFYLWIGTHGQTYAQKIKIPYLKHPVFDVFYEAQERGETFMTHAMSRAEKDSFFEYAFKYSDLKLMPAERKKYVMDCEGFARSFAWSKNSGITIQNYAGIPYSDQENDILKRFAQVFEQAYTRFLDVKNAEARALEATKQASLDRVRAEIASMRSKEDLNRITPLIWKELTALGISFIRCGVLIMDKSREMIHTYLSTPEGQSLTAFEMPFDEEGIARGASKHWAKNEIYTDFWDKNQFVRFMQKLINEGKIDNTKSFQGAFDPPEELYLNFVPFNQGMLYVGNISPLASNDLDLVLSLAKTFAMAFARYEDFKQLEAAKNKIENTLSELKSTQAQLIQSEKMASLGELTAGIAHEIQNPLNFVNNFSEVSKELIGEMNEELEKGDINEAKEIGKDIDNNLGKIIHHGKRASSIVKGMLEHSRTNNSEKELTDINGLADECLRLAYHGFRAKDKSFNADFKLELDETLPKINIVPQDIGRVLLNLINNAFYAVSVARSTKHEAGSYSYKPKVIVSTKILGDKIEIQVKDNGSGIPKNIVDKIFQPFFTTKPTGQGTGLGLSLSYDIVKAHGGELKVASKEGKGTEFIIQIPII